MDEKIILTFQEVVLVDLWFVKLKRGHVFDAHRLAERRIEAECSKCVSERLLDPGMSVFGNLFSHFFYL